MNENYILMCPVCASTVDAEQKLLSEDRGGGPAIQVFECLPCGQEWEMCIDPARMARHSLI